MNIRSMAFLFFVSLYLSGCVSAPTPRYKKPAVLMEFCSENKNIVALINGIALDYKDCYTARFEDEYFNDNLAKFIVTGQEVKVSIRREKA